LTLTGRQADVVHSLAEELDGRAVVADLSGRDGLQAVVEAGQDVDLLVANAGVGGGGLLTDYSLEELDRVIDLNLRVPVALAKVLGERMVGRGSGHLVFISSLAGKTANPASSLSNATRFGLRGFALGLRQDWGPLGVGVSCVNLGPIEEAPDGEDTALPAGFRPKSPADVAAAVVKAVRHDRAEVDVADPVMRAGVVLGQVAPQAVARLNWLAGGKA
jgi:short-subunit dehydrogenase